MATWTGALSKPTGYTPPKTATTVGGSASTLVSPKTLGVTTTTTPGYYGQSYTKTNGGEVDDAVLQDYVAKYGDEARDAVLDYFNDKDTYLSNNGMAGLENYMKNWYDSRQPKTTPTPAKTNTPAETTTASTSAVQGANTTNSQSAQADALSNNVNEGENKAKQTMTVQSGSDMGGVNYTNADSDNTTSSDSVMPGESATPTNQKYNSWIQNASTFGTSDENEKMPLTLTKTVYWSRRKK